MEIYIGALIFSIWYVTLFFGKTIGLSMLLFAVPITLFIINILAKSKKDINTKAKILIIPITLLSATYCIFDNYFFNKLNLFVIPVLIVYMILELLKDKIEFNWNFVGKILEIVLFPLNYIGINFQKLKVHLESYFNIDQKNDSDRKEIIRGLLITIPIVLVILTLLTSADTIFRNLINSILSVFLNVTGLIDVTGTTLRIIVAFCAFVYFMCLFDYITSRYEIEETSETKEVVKKKKDYSIKMVLGVLNIIYLIFCIIQIKSLFIKDININYAEYARQGFFQLMWVSLINLITILLAKKAEKQEGSTYIVSMCLIMILFTFIILVSSAVRMHYYESAYGYTFLRLLVYCILFTETILLIPTVMYVIDFEIELLRTYIAIVITIYVGMNFMNFNNVIARNNVDRYFETEKIDIYYLTRMGTDAVDQIIRLEEAQIETDIIEHELDIFFKETDEYLRKYNMDFRDFNISKSKAKELIEEKINFEDMEKDYVVNRY